MVVQGAVNPDEFYVKPTLAANRPAIGAAPWVEKSAWFTRRPREHGKQVEIRHRQELA